MRFFGLKCILCAISLITLFALDAKGGGKEFYYKVTAKASAKGAGKVYARTDTEHGPWLFKDEISSRHYEAEESNKEATETSIEEIVYLYAQAEEGFALSGWTDPNGSTITTGNSYSFHLTSTDVGSPNNFVFTAKFVPTYVSAFSANSDLCPVSVSPDINKAGDLVTITATPKSGVTILGWRIKGTSAIIASSEGRNSIQVTATSSKITYEPVFKFVGTQLGFIRIQSKSELDKFITLQQDEFSYTPIMYNSGGYGPLSGLNGDQEVAKASALGAAITYIKGGTYSSTSYPTKYINATGDFALTSGFYDPGTVIYAKGGNFYSQGTHLSYVTEGYSCHHNGGGSAGIAGAHLKVPGQTASFQNGGTFSMNPSVYGYSLGDIYLINDNGKLDVVTTSGTTDSYKWNQVPLDGNSQYFAFEPKLNDINGKYYATLRTGFSYKIKKPDIVKAYEVNEILQDGTVVKTPFADDEVIPGNLSVILESTSPEAIDNILLPYDITYTKQNSVLYNKYGTRLHCYTGEKSNNDQYDKCTEDGIGYFKVPYIGTSVIYKLGVNDAGDVGFFDKVNKNDIVSGNEGYSTQQCILFEKIKTQPVIAFDREQAYINNAIQATITSDVEGAKIQYSLDGGETWNEYTAPISLSKGEEGEYPIMAKASKVGFVDSDVATATCTFVKLTKPTISPESALAFF